MLVQLVASAPAPIEFAYCPVPAAACDFHTPGAVTSPVGPPHAAPTGSTTLAPGAGVIDADGAAGEADLEGVKEGVAEPVGEPVGLPEVEAVGVPVCEGEVPALQEGVGVLEEVGELLREAVGEAVLEQVGTSAMLPGKQDRGHPHAVQVAAEVAPRAAL